MFDFLTLPGDEFALFFSPLVCHVCCSKWPEKEEDTRKQQIIYLNRIHSEDIKPVLKKS